MENAVLETLIVKITAPLEALKGELRQASQASGQAGKEAGDNFTKSFRPDASAQVVAEMRQASAQGAAAAASAGRAAGDAYADGFRSQVNGIGQQLGSTLQTAFAVAAAAAGGAILASQFKEMAVEANAAQIAVEAWSRTLQRAKVDQDDAASTVDRLSKRFGVAKEEIYGAAEVLVRNKASLQQIEQLYTAVASSALKAGKPVARAWEDVSVAVATGRSELVEQYGLITNFGPAMDKFAKSVGKSADDLTDQQRVLANINPILKETQAEVADVDLYLQGFTKTTSDNTNAQKALRKEIGEAVLPAVSAFTQASTNAMQSAAQWMQDNRATVIPTLGKVAIAVFDAGNGIVMFGQLAILTTKTVVTAVGGLATVLVGIVATVTGTVGGIIAATVGGIREALNTAGDIISKLKAAKDAALSGDFAGAGAQLLGAKDRAAQGVNTIGSGYGKAIGSATTFGRSIIAEGVNDITAVKDLPAQAMGITNAALNRSEAFRVTVDKTTASVLKFGAATGGTVQPLKEMNDATGKAADKSKKSAAEKEKERQATEAARIAFDKWKDSLKNATTAQLQAALARAEANKDYDKWKAISAELERREGILTAATKKAAAERAAAAKREADERERAAERIRDAQASINEDNALKKLEADARNASDARLKELLSAAYKDGDRNRYNLIAGILKDRADARTQADKDFAQALKEGEQAGVDALNEVLSDPANFATGIDRAGTAIPAAQSQFDSLFDTLFELRDELNTPGIADAFIDGLEETARQGNLTAKELRTLVDVVNDLSAPRESLLPDNLQGRGVTNEPDATDPASGYLIEGEAEQLAQAFWKKSGAELQGLLDGLKNQDSPLAELFKGSIQAKDLIARIELETDPAKLQGLAQEVADFLDSNIGKNLPPTVKTALATAVQGATEYQNILAQTTGDAVTDGFNRANGADAVPTNKFNDYMQTLIGDSIDLTDPEQLRGVTEELNRARTAGELTAQEFRLLQMVIDSINGSEGLHIPVDMDETRLEDWNIQLTSLTEGYAAGAISAADLKEQVIDALPKLEALAKAAEAQGKTDLARYYRDAADGLRELLTPLDTAIEGFKQYATYAQQLAGALGNLAEGAGGEDLSANLKGAANLAGQLVALAGDVARIVANPADIGAWVGAITKVINGISEAMNGFRKAREQAAKMQKDFNEQFTFINGDNFSKTFVRSRGWLADTFGGGPEVKQEIDKVGLMFAKSLEGGFVSGIKGGLKEALEKNDFSLFSKALKESVYDGILEGIVDAFINGELLKNIIGPAIKAWADAMKTPDTADDAAALAGIDAAISQVDQLAGKFFSDVAPKLNGIKDQWGVEGSGGGSGGGTSSMFGAGPGASFGAVVTFPQSVLDAMKQPSIDMGVHVSAFGGHVGSFGEFVQQFGEFMRSGGNSYGMQSAFRR